MARSGTPPRSARTNDALAGELLRRLRETFRRRAACCTSARASGIRANRCRAGRSPATGAPMACRCGSDPALARRHRISDYGFGARPTRSRSRRRWRTALDVDPSYVIPAYEDPLALSHEGAPASGQRRSAGQQAGRSGGTGASARSIFARARASRSASFCRFSAPTGKSGPAWQSGPLDAAGAASVPDSRRFARGVASAAGIAALGARRREAEVCRRPIPWPREPARQCHSARSERRPAARANSRSPRESAAQPPPAGEPQPRPVVRTALCVEPRDGKLFVFLPPRRIAEDYVELMAAIEDTAADTGHAGADRRLYAASRSRGCRTSR